MVNPTGIKEKATNMNNPMPTSDAFFNLQASKINFILQEISEYPLNYHNTDTLEYVVIDI